ncbi:MAG: hypothetical protein HY270_04775, partial [Deltaproteobacteria bacterium]|nr:hypothetical protein [Deltaproteobacteria bacterium]
AELSGAYEDLKSAQAQLVHSEKMASLGQLVAGVAHELNNPASFVQGGLTNIADFYRRVLEMLQWYEQQPLREAQSAEAVALRQQTRLDFVRREMPELLRICIEGSERIAKIVEDLRTFARMDQGERMLVDVGAGIDSCLRLLSDRCKQMKVAIHFEKQPLPRIPASEGQLNQVWMNLLTNALDALQGRPQPTLVIRLQPSERHGRAGVEVEVVDNGCGIDPHIRSRIFEPFFTTKPIGEGTGLGLSIAYGSVKGHNGTIEAIAMPDGGTCMRVWLPATTQPTPNI